MDFLTLFGLGLYGNTVNKYNKHIEYKNELGNIPRYYDNIYSCNQINNNRKKVYLHASNNYLKSLEPNTNIINNIWRLQKKDTYNQIQQNDVYIQPSQDGDIINITNIKSQEGDIINIKSQEGDITNIKSQDGDITNIKSQEGEIREHFITNIRTFFDRIRKYSFYSIICLIVLSCLFCCM